MKIRVLELFGGIRDPHLALKNLGFDVKTVDYVELPEEIINLFKEKKWN